jgi:histidinol-phosphate/aromatic aminotransferase/cobyric acid decarboxylase-like protein
MNMENCNKLESVIDSNSVKEVLDAIAAICLEKSDHIESNWQDIYTAKVWLKAGRKIEALAAKILI